MSREGDLATGAGFRLTGTVRERVVVCVDGGSERERPGDWSATIEWLVRRLSPRFPELAFLEVRYRTKSWRRLELCIEDGRAAVQLARERGARRCTLVGFSMGGAVAISVAGEPSVTDVIGLAPWIPDRLDVSPLDGRSIAILHGSLDRPLPGIPGVSAASSRRGLERIRARGVEATYAVIPGALHGAAIRSRRGGLVPLPRARRWGELLAAALRARELPYDVQPFHSRSSVEGGAPDGDDDAERPR
ncbi:MAG: dienelactone hydrolase family protein [Actinobacteria bacterium]|nr:dienelactone hydrolase family protein [Actinomycetota bacterium]